MARVLQRSVLNNIQFVPLGATLNSAYHQWRMDKEWFRDAQLSWQKKTNYKQKVQLTDRINVQFHRTEVNDINLYILACDGTVLENLTTLAQKVVVTGNTYEGEQLYTHHFSFRFQDYSLPAGTYYLRVDAIYYDGVDPVDTLSEISEPLLLKASHPDTVYVEYQYLVNKENVIFVHPDINTFRFGLRFEGYLGDFNAESSDVYFKEQDYDQRVISSKAWRKFTLHAGGFKGYSVPPYIIDKLNAAMSCGQSNGILLINGVQYTKDEGAKMQVEQLNNNVFPSVTANIDVREYNPERAITYNRGSAFQIVEGMNYPFHVQRVNFLNPYYNAVILANPSKVTVIEDSAGLDDFVDYLNNERFPLIGMRGTAERRGSDIWYVNGEGENYTLGLRYQNQYRLDFTVAANSTPLPFNLVLGEGYGTIYWDNDKRTLHEPTSTTAVKYNTTYEIDNTYNVELWHNGTIRVISHSGVESIVNGVTTYGARITDVGGSAPWRMRTFILDNEDFSGLASGLDLHFLSNSGIVNDQLKTLTLSKSGLTAFDGTVFADNNFTALNPWWAQLNVINLTNNSLSVSELNSFVNDFYDYTPHFGNSGIMYLTQVPTALATGTALTNINNLKAANWTIIPY